MSFTAVLETPEFIFAAILGLVLLQFQGDDSTDWNVPQWLSIPAVAAVSSLPASYVIWLQKTQTWSGWRNNSAFGKLASLKIYGCILSFLTALFLPFWVVPFIVLTVFFSPDGVMHLIARKRQQQIRQSLPQALDLMVLCVDAGLALDATLQKIATEKSSISKVLNEELLILGRDVLLGMERERAYQELYARTGVDELRSLGSSLNQSAKLGLSIARILRGQSDFLRLKLSQKAEERAAKLPIYMAFPLWFCIMPALLVVLLAPSLIMFFQHLQAGPSLFR